ncbi:MAG: cytochrome b/b6 domain-containing protein [Chitinophagaceae bacterium]|nr:cytochrome b/b6 domain-containing protein [Chitinophagaceae bacterium]
MHVKIIHKHKLATRWMHWINFPLLTIMIWSGMLIYWANDVYEIKIGGKVLVKFFPQWFYNIFHVPHRLSEGMAFHFVFMWLFMVNGLFYVIYTVFTGEWRYLLPNKKSFKEAWQVLLHDLHLRKQKPPQTKYNAAQRVAYSMIILMGFGSMATGFAIYKPFQLQWLMTICGGYAAARVEHFILTLGYVLFFVIHVVQVMLAGWHNFKAMVSGFEVIKIKEETSSTNIENKKS